jgi:hypothetical protein
MRSRAGRRRSDLHQSCNGSTRGRDELVAPTAIAARREIEPQLSGTDLIHVDQLVAAYVEAPRQKALQALYAQDGKPALQGARAVDDGKLVRLTYDYAN